MNTKLKIDPFVFRLIKENGAYLTVIGTAAILILVAFILFAVKIVDYQTQIAAIETEAAELTKKRDIIRYSDILAEGGIDVQRMSTLLSLLTPNQEDYFSILSALDRLSADTGFIVKSYTINLSTKDPKKLSLQIVGSGDTQAFLSFLKSYNFGGGRLMTMDKINFESAGAEEIKLSVNFYTAGNKKLAPITSTFSGKDIEMLKRIKATMGEMSAPVDTGSKTIYYETKSNTF